MKNFLEKIRVKVQGAWGRCKSWVSHRRAEFNLWSYKHFRLAIMKSKWLEEEYQYGDKIAKKCHTTICKPGHVCVSLHAPLSYLVSVVALTAMSLVIGYNVTNQIVDRDYGINVINTVEDLNDPENHPSCSLESLFMDALDDLGVKYTHVHAGTVPYYDSSEPDASWGYYMVNEQSEVLLLCSASKKLLRTMETALRENNCRLEFEVLQETPAFRTKCNISAETLQWVRENGICKNGRYYWTVELGQLNPSKLRLREYKIVCLIANVCHCGFATVKLVEKILCTTVIAIIAFVVLYKLLVSLVVPALVDVCVSIAARRSKREENR